MSSLRTDGGPNTEAVLALGRKLVEHLEPHDHLSRWMAHHLAALIDAAGDEDATTPEQRIEIIDLILRIWSKRRDLPRPVPGEAVDKVMAALERLGDDSPFAFSRYGHRKHVTEQDVPGGSLLEVAVDLERSVRGTIAGLIAMALAQAEEHELDWIEAAGLIGLEEEVDGNLAIDRVRTRLRELSPLEPDGNVAGSEPSWRHRGWSGGQASELRDLAEVMNAVADSLESRMADNTALGEPG